MAKKKSALFQLTPRDIVDCCKARDESILHGLVTVITTQTPDDSPILLVAARHLVEKEIEIVREEHYLELHPGAEDRPIDLDEERRTYVRWRRTLVDAMTQERFDPAYAAAKKDHNDCARANLDQSDGTMIDYVLPEFRPDGTHKPWGPKDVPWNVQA